MITLKNNKKELFDTIAEKYDRINNAISLFTHNRFKKDAINKIPNEHYSILDLCCGTGDICELLKKKYPNSSIIGLDFSQKMLNIAKRKHQTINFLEHDITNLPFDNESFDLCTISFGLRNVEDMEKVLKEINRVLKKDGIFLNLDIGKPNKFWNMFLKPYMNILVPILGKLASGDILPFKYFVHSSLAFPSPDELKEKFFQNNLKQIYRKDYNFGQISCQICKKIN